MARFGNPALALALSTSMRTLGSQVVRGRWGKSLSGGSLSEAFAVHSVADYMGAGLGRAPFPAQPGSVTLRVKDELGKEVR